MFWSSLNQPEFVMTDTVEVAYDVYPLTVEEYETGIIQDGSWNILADAPDVEVE